MPFSLKISEQCHSCGVCMDICPVLAIDMTLPDRSSIEGGIESKPWMMEYPFVTGKCIGCNLCEIECPFGAITIVKSEEPILEVLTDDSMTEALKVRGATKAPEPQGPKDWQTFHPLSSLTREPLKRPVRSSFPEAAHWKPWRRKKGEKWKVWR